MYSNVIFTPPPKKKNQNKRLIQILLDQHIRRHLEDHGLLEEENCLPDSKGYGNSEVGQGSSVLWNNFKFKNSKGWRPTLTHIYPVMYHENELSHVGEYMPFVWESYGKVRQAHPSSLDIGSKVPVRPKAWTCKRCRGFCDRMKLIGTWE